MPPRAQETTVFPTPPAITLEDLLGIPQEPIVAVEGTLDDDWGDLLGTIGIQAFEEHVGADLNWEGFNADFESQGDGRESIDSDTSDTRSQGSIDLPAPLEQWDFFPHLPHLDVNRLSPTAWMDYRPNAALTWQGNMVLDQVIHLPAVDEGGYVTCERCGMAQWCCSRITSNHTTRTGFDLLQDVHVHRQCPVCQVRSWPSLGDMELLAHAIHVGFEGWGWTFGQGVAFAFNDD